MKETCDLLKFYMFSPQDSTRIRDHIQCQGEHRLHQSTTVHSKMYLGLSVVSVIDTVQYSHKRFHFYSRHSPQDLRGVGLPPVGVGVAVF